MLSTKWVCRTECSFCILLVPMVYCIMTDLVLSTKWVNRIECSFADRPDSTNGDSVLPYCQQNGSAVQNVVSVIDPLQQIMTLKIGETTNYTAGSSIHINKFVDQQYGSTTQIVVSAPTSTNGVIPNRQNWYGELYECLYQSFHLFSHQSIKETVSVAGIQMAPLRTTYRRLKSC